MKINFFIYCVNRRHTRVEKSWTRRKVQFDILTRGVYILHSYARWCSPSPPQTSHEHCCTETPESGGRVLFAQTRLFSCKCGRTMRWWFSQRFYIILFRSCFFKPLRAARARCIIIYFVSRNRVKRKTIKKKIYTTWRREKNVNDKHRLRARTYVYIYIYVRYTLRCAYMIITVLALHWLSAATACSDNDGRNRVSILYI